MVVNAALVDDLLKLKRQKAELERQIDELQRLFIEGAQFELRKDHKPPFVGCRYDFQGKGGLVRVNFPEHKLITSFTFNDRDEAFRTSYAGDKPEKIKLPGLRKLAGEKFGVLFATFYKPAKAFRELLPTHVTPLTESKLLDLCTEPSSPRVSTEVAEVVP